MLVPCEAARKTRSLLSVRRCHGTEMADVPWTNCSLTWDAVTLWRCDVSVSDKWCKCNAYVACLSRAPQSPGTRLVVADYCDVGEKASAFSSPPCQSGQSPSRPSQTRELMMLPADQIREQNEQDPGRVASAMNRFQTGQGPCRANLHNGSCPITCLWL